MSEGRRIPSDRINNDFAYYSPGVDYARRHEEVRVTARQFAHFINRTCPPGRETSLALTKIEEAMFWANAAFAREPRPESE